MLNYALSLVWPSQMRSDEAVTAQVLNPVAPLCRCYFPGSKASVQAIHGPVLRLMYWLGLVARVQVQVRVRGVRAAATRDGL
jgi:hypothetical protein